MTTAVLSLAVFQAAFLLWGAIHLSNVFMRPEKSAWALRCLAALSIPVALAWYGVRFDPQRVLCSVGDCFALVLSVGFIRIWLVTREEDQLTLESAITARAAAMATAAARRAEALERVKAAAAALEASETKAAKKENAPPVPPRHATPSLLRGGAPSPRLPSSPRKIPRAGPPPG